MFSRIVMKRGAKEEAEKPFWISYADFMTALMVLFLVVMSVALLMVTPKVPPKITEKEAEAAKAIKDCMGEVSELAKDYSGVRVDAVNRKIDFGDRARFDHGKHELTTEQAQLLREFIPGVLDLATHKSCNGWLKEIVVDGFTSKTGPYLANLNLSLQRAQRVICVLLDKPSKGKALTDEQREKVRELFRVGGYSFNSSKPTLEESRRVELRLEFRAVTDKSNTIRDKIAGEIGSCPI